MGCMVVSGNVAIGEVQVIEFVRFSSEESEKESREVNRGPGTQLSKPWGVTADGYRGMHRTRGTWQQEGGYLERKEMVRDD